MRYKKFSAFLIMLAVVGTLQSCGGGGGGGGSNNTQPMGAVTLSAMDAPGDFDHVWITIKDVWFHTSDTVGPLATGWVKFPLTTPVTVDLMTLANGNSQSIWNNIQLPEGTYQTIRIFLAPTFAANPPSGHQFYNEAVIGGTTYPLHVPDANHGIALVGSFNVSTAVPLNLAIDFDAGHDIVEFHEGKDFVLKPRLAYFDMDNAAAIKGKLLVSAGSVTVPRFVIKAEKLVSDSTSTTMPTYHAVKRWTIPDSSGNFVLYPVSCPTATTTYDVVIRGLNHQTVIIKNVPVSKGTTTTTATDLGTITMTPSSVSDYTVAGTIASPSGSWVQFYQTLSGAGEYPYEIRFRHFNPLWGGFRKIFALSNDQIRVGTYSGGVVSGLTPAAPAEGTGGFQAVAGALLFNRSSSSVVSSATTTVSFPTPLTVISPYQGNSVTGSIVMSDPAKMNSMMDSGLLFAVRGGMIVDAIRVDSQMATGGSYSISNLPGGSTSTPLAGAFYGIDAIGWLSSDPTGTYKAVALPQVVDLTTGNDTATMTMYPLW